MGSAWSARYGGFWQYARPYTPSYAVGFFLLLLTNALSLWIPWLLKNAIDAIESGEPLAEIAWIAVAMATVAVVRGVVRTGSRLTMLGNSRKIAYDVRNRFFSHLQSLGASFFDRFRTGDVMSRGINDIQLLQSFYGPGAMNFLNTIVVYVAVLVLLLRIDPVLTVVSLVTYPVLFLGVNRISRKVFARSMAVQEQLAEISNRAQENISGIQQVKTYVQEQRETDAFRELAAEFRKRNLSMAAIRGGMLSLIGTVTGVGTLIVLYVGGRFVIEGRIGFGDFVAFNAYLGLLVWPTIAFGWIINTIQRGAGAMERLEAVFVEQPDIPSETAEDEPLSAEPIDGDIELTGLTFRYPGAGGEPALQGIDVTIRRGERVAIVGPVGAGKSTLVALLARTYPVDRGMLKIGGMDVNDIPVRRLRASIGYVPQEALLFSQSLKENIRFGELPFDVPGLPASEPADRLDLAVQISHLTGDVAALPQGLETTVGERGFTLSGGQRQRATLARAVIGNRRILILDDSLSSVDADTERAILEQLDQEAKDRTTILVTHRFSTLANMQRILVLDAGRLVEQGTHTELLERGGTYAGLFRRDALRQSLEGDS